MIRSKVSDPLRVALYDTSGRGGIAQYTYFLAEGLASAGCRVTLLTGHDYEMRGLPRQFDIVEIFKPSWIRSVGSALRSAGRSNLRGRSTTPAGTAAPVEHADENRLRGSAVLRRMRFKWLLLLAAGRVLAAKNRILHIQWCGNHAETIWFIKLLRRMGIRTVYTAHDILPHGGASASEREALVELYGSVDHLVVFSAETRRQLLAGFDVRPERVSVIPIGGNEAFGALSQDAARRELRIDPDRGVILFFGTIKPYKGIEYLIEAFERVRERAPRATLLVAGGGSPSNPEEADYYASILSKLEARSGVVRALEYIPVSRMGLYFSAADLVVLPYTKTYHSGVVMSAYAAARPVIVTNTGGLAEAVEEGRTGYVVPPKDVAALAEKIARVLTMPDRGAGMGKRAREVSEAMYSWSAVGRRHLALYLQLLEARGNSEIERNPETVDPAALGAEPDASRTGLRGC